MWSAPLIPLATEGRAHNSNVCWLIYMTNHSPLGRISNSNVCTPFLLLYRKSIQSGNGRITVLLHLHCFSFTWGEACGGFGISFSSLLQPLTLHSLPIFRLSHYAKYAVATKLSKEAEYRGNKGIYWGIRVKICCACDMEEVIKTWECIDTKKGKNTLWSREKNCGGIELLRNMVERKKGLNAGYRPVTLH